MGVSETKTAEKEKLKRAIVKTLSKKMPTTALAVGEQHNITMVYARRLLNELREEGLVELKTRNTGWLKAG